MEDSQEMQEGQVIDEVSPSAEDERIAELETQLEQARQEAAENWNKYLRERADMENFRKRQERIAADRLQREVMRSEGITPVPTVGEVFDPYVHEAIEAVEDSDQPEGMVVEEVLKGYKLGDETLRPARVKVSTGNKETQD